jgi:DHA2 family multidrug resistance protein
MPLTGYFTHRFGQKKFLFASIMGFVVTSVLCGLASSLSEIVVFRLLQGITGAALVPLSQSIMVATFPHEERGKAMAIWGIGVMVGPILGPTLGGWLTEFISWRWTFFINLPFGLLSAFLVLRYIPDSERSQRSMDWMGLTLMAMGVAGLQFVLDRGAQDDWFASPVIQFAAFISLLGFAGFYFHTISHKGHTLFSPEIFKDRNFMTASLLMAFLGLGLFGSMLLQPLMLEGLMDYPTLTTGLTLAPRGIASMVSMMIVGRLISRVDPRWLIIFGIFIFSLGSYQTTQYSLEMGIMRVIFPMILQGMGLGMVFIPLSTLAFSTLPQRFAAEAAGMYSLLRTIGSAIGVSVVVTVLINHAQVAWHNLGGHLQPYNPALSPYLAQLGMTEQSPQAAGILAGVLTRQSQMLGFLDAYLFVTVAFAAMAPIVFIMKNKQVAEQEVVQS